MGSVTGSTAFVGLRRALTKAAPSRS
jgi:hypothetical protein